MHRLGGFKEEPHILAITEAYKNNGYTVVTFDTANTIGESEGDYEYATITNYLEDLEDVIAWSKEQDWYSEPLHLCGHSLGAICATEYAIHNPDEVAALIPISSVISGELSVQSPFYAEEAPKWKAQGWREWKSDAKPGIVKRLPWSHMEDRMNYNLLDGAELLTMPVLVMVGSEDPITPPDHQKMLFEALDTDKEYYEIEGAGHTFPAQEHLDDLQQTIDEWLQKY